MNEKEICICAAVLFEKENGEELIIRGHRHTDCFHNMHLRPDKKLWKQVEQGFITSHNRFVSRQLGRRLQDEAGMESKDPDGYRCGTLFSEDLY